MDQHISFHNVSIDDIERNEVYVHGPHARVRFGEVGEQHFDMCFDSVHDLRELGEWLIDAAAAAAAAPKDGNPHFCWVDRSPANA